MLVCIRVLAERCASHGCDVAVIVAAAKLLSTASLNVNCIFTVRVVICSSDQGNMAFYIAKVVSSISSRLVRLHARRAWGCSFVAQCWTAKPTREYGTDKAVSGRK